MRVARHLAVFILCLPLFACSTPGQSKARQKFETSVDELCSWTGMTRSGPIVGIERRRNPDRGYNVTVSLNVDGSTRPYVVRFDSHRRLMSFTPEPFDLSNMIQGVGYDTLKAPDERARCITAVNELNRLLRWTWYGSPAIQRAGSGFIVSYFTVSPAKQKKYGDPYVSFLVTAEGTVFAVFFGG